MNLNSPIPNSISPSASASTSASTKPSSIRSLIMAGLVLGLGQGGFFDGIIFHQLLQWHHMFSSVATDRTIAGIELNTIGDGLFHLLNWVLTLVGIGLLWKAGRQVQNNWSGQLFMGALLMGMGLFNLIEGILDHHILGIHHLKPGIHQGLWDIGFLLSGVILVAIGWLMIGIHRSKSAKEV
ncbi:MAG: DUF2243 domain-containing protein [Oculatellaceae cyanobacterium Prado106]|nr:DUF2243 domain-containing protein [Oculatellaceae cyanobacterium Prado106]